MITLSIRKLKSDISLWTISQARTSKSYYHRSRQWKKKTISRRIKSALDELRQIPAQGYFGNLERQPYTDGVLSSPDDNPTISGPFENQEQMNQGILTRLGQKESPPYIRLLRGMVDRTLKRPQDCLHARRSPTKKI